MRILLPPAKTCWKAAPIAPDIKSVRYKQSGPGCASTTFSMNGARYSKCVVGLKHNYQDKTPDAFRPYHARRATTVDSSGATLTHGRFPRYHIWTVHLLLLLMKSMELNVYVLIWAFLELFQIS